MRRLLPWAAFCLLGGRADAHGLQFLLAKVTPTQNGRLMMEISADFTANPLIADENAAETVIANILTIQDQGAPRKVGASQGIRFQRTRDIDPTCPVQIPPAPGGLRHELVTGYLEEVVTGSSLEFGIPKGNPHDVILWTMPVDGQGAAVKKFSLIAGDTVKLDLTEPRSNRWKVGAITCGVVLILAGILFAFARQRRSRKR